MGLILDTDVLIHWERTGKTIDLNPYEKYGEAAISVIVASELLVGVHRADTETRRGKRSAFVEAILLELPVLEFTTEIARVHAELFARLASQGQMIGAHDLIIAATAIYHKSALLTMNVRDFQRIINLEVVRLPV